MKIKLIKQRSALTDNILVNVEKKVNEVITKEFKHLHYMKIFVLDKDDDDINDPNVFEKEGQVVDERIIDPDYLGVFIKNAYHDTNGNIEKTDRNENYPYIEIYPNRIKKALKVKSFANHEFLILMAKVIIHELAHAFMFGAQPGASNEEIARCEEELFKKYYKDGVWFKTLEESLANWLAYGQNWEYEDREMIRRFISMQPEDYKHALSLINANKSPYALATEWKKLKCDVNGCYFFEIDDAKALADQINNCCVNRDFSIEYIFRPKDKELFKKLGKEKYLRMKKIKVNLR